MMEIRLYAHVPPNQAQYVRECLQHPVETEVCSWKQANERTDEHNAALHPRKWHRHQRRLEILAELQRPLRDLIAVEDTTSAQAWGAALPFDPPPMTRERLAAEGLLPVAPGTEMYRREFTLPGDEKETR